MNQNHSIVDVLDGDPAGGVQWRLVSIAIGGLVLIPEHVLWELQVPASRPVAQRQADETSRTCQLGDLDDDQLIVLPDY